MSFIRQLTKSMRSNRSTLVCILSFLMFLGHPADTMANGFRLPDQDAEATARGDAFAATADNPSAIYYNPAGIGQLSGASIRLGTYGLAFKTSYDAPSGRSFDTSDRIN